MPHILILGGGFGGLPAVATLQDRFGGDADITLVDRAERFFIGSPSCGTWPAFAPSTKLRGLSTPSGRMASVSCGRM